ncbi:MAG: hypothetical protein DYG83_05415 [Candidatus Brocadia sp. AMX2]|uniref:Protein FAM33A n=1 Tax=Candidatus Brocadia sinica JPN1 TaxID=1197129 RepID=A0ABQ0K260_9BACT|nr:MULTISPECIES: hypothetical protein [Brocadia]MBC6931554.1 hypothetical protein [Candidatus Brocadia sp.]MBL1169195.1 hypothetical protein [Candidatus Brocadia sp. AMX1]NOG42928.1 hypothetical protein [Planctomycetota bacterium]GIK12158.1 MAG: hypothetical protein BroJett002_08650 [Candidatus Brocadia sinica]KAA0242500.1 MAG: hypothetical protein EDM70_14130 [Candidatus Brocadia sp. AMX2]
MGNTSDEVRLLDEEIKGIQGEIKSLEVMYEIHSLQQTLDKYDEIPVSDVILSATEEKLLSKLKELSSPLLNFPTVCDQLEEYNRELGILARSREDKLNKIILNETTTNTTEDTQGNSYLLDNANTLHIGEETIRFQPSRADLLRFMIRETGSEKFLELQYILTYHYGIDTMSKTTLSKKERQPFEKEKNAINKLCKEALQKDLIVSLGDKKYTSSINIKLPKNSPKDFP